jgi:FkbM family methyltransferase
MNILSIKLRSIGRKLGLHHLVWRVRKKLQPNRDYEGPCHRALEATIRQGDVVWDIGANVGFYTELFCKWVGPQGRVVAFEPNPEAMAMIKDRMSDCTWLDLESIAMGSRDEVSSLVVQEGHTIGHVHYGAEKDLTGQIQVPIQVAKGDTVRERLGRTPTVLKIDVEGYEEEVLLGMNDILSSPNSRAFLIEVHFAELESRGQAEAPIRIERLLKSKGFRLKWVDANHLLATQVNSSGLQSEPINQA